MNNTFQLIGNLGADPESKQTDNGMVTTLSLATTDYWKKDGKKMEKTQWHRVTCFGKIAESCNTYLKKGRQIAIKGKISYSQYEKNGEKVYATNLTAEGVQFLGSANKNELVEGNTTVVPF